MTTDTLRFWGERIRAVLEWATPLLDLAIRLHVARAFFMSGLTKLRDWDSTLLLFREEYHVPLLPPAVAAVCGTCGELVLPVFLALGLASRFAAAGISVLNVVAVVSYWHVLHDQDAALQQHFYWGLLLLVTLLHGPGKLSLDNLVWKRLNPAGA
jgi:putative oxidoreductase